LVGVGRQRDSGHVRGSRLGPATFDSLLARFLDSVDVVGREAEGHAPVKKTTEA
jgi:hypothetical protein